MPPECALSSIYAVGFEDRMGHVTFLWRDFREWAKSDRDVTQIRTVNI